MDKINRDWLVGRVVKTLLPWKEVAGSFPGPVELDRVANVAMLPRRCAAEMHSAASY